MKIIVERDALASALAFVSSRAKNGSTIPILSHLLLTVANNRLTLCGHDLDSCSQAGLIAEVATDGEIAVPADQMNRLVSGLAKGAQISLSADDKQAHIRCGRASYKFSVLPATDFPGMLCPKEPVTFNLSGDQIARLFGTPAPFADDGPSRPYLNGVYFHVREKRLVGCATNGHVLVRTIADEAPDAFDGVIVPTKSCAEFVKLAGGAEATIEVAPNLVAIVVGDRRFVSKVIDGTFPDYERVIPSPTASPITVDTKEFSGALGRLIAARDPESRSMPTIRLFWNNDLSFLSASLQSAAGSGQEEIECDGPARPAGEVGASVDYLREVADSIGGKTLKFFIAGPGDPIRIENPNDPDFVSVVMPHRL